MRIIAALVSLLLSQSLHSQTYFNKAYDIDGVPNNASVIIEESSGNYLFPGAVFNPPWGTLNISKLDSAGDTLWVKKYTKKKTYYSTGASGSIIKTRNGNYVFCGSVVDSLSNSDALLVKFKPTGDTIWTRTYGGPAFDHSNIVIESKEDSGFVLIGVTQSFGNGGSDFYMIKTDSLGKMKWYKTFGTSGTEDAVSGQQTLDGGYILSGRKSNMNYIVKTDKSGGFQWEKLYAGTKSVCFLKQLVDSSYILTGLRDVSGKGEDACISKVDKLGVLVWRKSCGTGVDDWLYSIPVILSDGSIVTAGQTMNGSIPYGWLLKTNSTGDSTWAKVFFKNTSVDNYFYEVKQTSDKGFIMSGFGYVSTSDGWTVKVDSMSCEIPNCNVGTGKTKTLNAGLRQYPNPATNKLTIELNDAISTKGFSLVVYDALGKQCVYKTDIMSKEEVDISFLPGGIYLLQIINPFRITNRKFIKQ